MSIDNAMRSSQILKLTVKWYLKSEVQLTGNTAMLCETKNNKNMTPRIICDRHDKYFAACRSTNAVKSAFINN